MDVNNVRISIMSIPKWNTRVEFITNLDHTNISPISIHAIREQCMDGHASKNSFKFINSIAEIANTYYNYYTTMQMLQTNLRERI